MMVFKITAESVSSYYAIENYFLLFCIFSKISLLTSGKDALSYTRRDKERPPALFCFDQAKCLPSRGGEYVRTYVRTQVPEPASLYFAL